MSVKHLFESHFSPQLSAPEIIKAAHTGFHIVNIVFDLLKHTGLKQIIIKVNRKEVAGVVIKTRCVNTFGLVRWIPLSGVVCWSSVLTRPFILCVLWKACGAEGGKPVVPLWLLLCQSHEISVVGGACRELCLQQGRFRLPPLSSEFTRYWGNLCDAWGRWVMERLINMNWAGRLQVSEPELGWI